MEVTIPVNVENLLHKIRMHCIDSVGQNNDNILF
jgi:hypothetical protein